MDGEGKADPASWSDLIPKETDVGSNQERATTSFHPQVILERKAKKEERREGNVQMLYKL